MHKDDQDCENKKKIIQQENWVDEMKQRRVYFSGKVDSSRLRNRGALIILPVFVIIHGVQRIAQVIRYATTLSLPLTLPLSTFRGENKVMMT